MRTKFFMTALVAITVPFCLFSQQIDKRVFEMLDLNRKGLEKVKGYHLKGDDEKAARELLRYYRERGGITIPGFDPGKVKLSDEERKMADESLEHKFYVHRGYQPSFFYGKDIDWTYWPVRDNELRWQLHRLKWFTPLGEAYRVTGDEKYAAAYVEHYTDWLAKNPYPEAAAKRKIAGGNTAGDPDGDGLEGFDENARFAWRPLEVSERINTQPEQFSLLIGSQSFTPQFLTVWLAAFGQHCDHIMNFFSGQGNHLLFEAQRLSFAGIFMPEFKDAAQWRERSVSILNDEINKQVYEDGTQYELDPHYHLAAINIFASALSQASVNGYGNSFPESYKDRIEKMIEMFYNISFPDYSTPLFSDNRRHNASVVKKNYADWAGIFPRNRQIAFFASGGKEGEAPEYNSKAMKAGGFYTLRNGWDKNSTVMIVKAGPPAFWHNQPDNGTFDLMIKGRSFLFDSGCYIYGGDAEILKQREWFRQTMVHNTLTLDDRNLEVADSKCLLFRTGDDGDVVVVENPSYKGLTHRRSIFFVDHTYFVILDEASGDAAGKVAVHYQMGENHVATDPRNNLAYTDYEDGNNIVLQVSCSGETAFEKEEGWVSYSYREKLPRESFGVSTDKKSGETVRFVTVITPVRSFDPQTAISAGVLEADGRSAKLRVTINGNTKDLQYTL